MLRASEVAERLGIPSVSIIASGFMKQAAVTSKGMGIPFAIAEYPGVPMVDSDETLRSKVIDHLLPAVIKGLTARKVEAEVVTEREPEPGSVVFEGSLDEVEQHFHARMWSDGLPIIPPTRQRVDAFLKFTDRNPADVIAVLPQEGRAASIHSIAVNGVMAGCRPEYMPLLIAAVEVLADPNFRIEDAGSTPSWEPLVIVNGPIIKDIALNYGGGVMKIGRQANSSIGRFVRLYMRNLCGYRIPPGDGDKGSIGATFNVALAEDEDSTRDIGWPTFAMDQGFAADENVVTMQSVVCYTAPTYSSGATAVTHARQFVDAMGPAFAYWSYTGVKRGIWHPLLVIGPSIARVIASQWTKDQLRQYLWENTTIPASLMQQLAVQTGAQPLDFKRVIAEGLLPPDYVASDDPHRPVRIYVKPEHIGIVVAGDSGRNQSRGYMPNHTQGARTSHRVQLPQNWKQLLASVRG